MVKKLQIHGKSTETFVRCLLIRQSTTYHAMVIVNLPVHGINSIRTAVLLGSTLITLIEATERREA